MTIKTLLYFNTQICEYPFLLTDGTTDYVAADDFDDIDLISSEQCTTLCSFIAHLCILLKLI